MGKFINPKARLMKQACKGAVRAKPADPREKKPKQPFSWGWNQEQIYWLRVSLFNVLVSVEKKCGKGKGIPVYVTR